MPTTISRINSSGVLSTRGEIDEVTLYSGSIYFDGSSALSFTANSAFAFGSGDYTVEMWYNPSVDYSGANNGYLFDHSDNQTRVQLNLNRVRYFYNTGGTGTELASPTDGLGLTVGTWYHLAIVRNSSLITMYINGVGVASVPSADDETQTSFNIGQSGGSSSRFTGYISNFRIVKGVAVYTGNFTRPTVPLTAVSSTSLLLNNSYLGAFVDTSGNNLQFTQVGTPVSSTVTPPFLTKTESVSVSMVYSYKTPVEFDEVWLANSGNSIYFDGTSAMSFTANDVFKFGSGAYTIDMWYRPAVSYAAINGYLFDHANNQTRVQLLNNYVIYYYNLGATALTSTVAGLGVNAGTWYHLAIVRNSANLITMYINGVSVASVTSATDETQNTFNIAQSGNANNRYTGYISNFRIVNGAALYTGNFTPPSAPSLLTPETQFLLINSKLSNSIADISKNSIIPTLTAVSSDFLLNYSFVSNSFKDSSANNITATSVGAPTGNATMPYTYDAANGSMYFNGTSALTFPANSAFAFGAGDYTVEMWYNSPSLNSTYGGYLYDHGNNTNRIQFNANSVKYFYISDSVGISSPAGVGLTPNIWYHLAVVRASGIVTMYLNGQAVATGNDSTDVNQTSFTIGQSGGSSSRYTGYINNFRIVKGYAVYTADFTPPTGPLQVTSLPSASTVSPFVPVTGDSVYFNGSSYLSIADNTAFDLASGNPNYTLECWIYMPTGGGSGAIIQKGNRTGSWVGPYSLEASSSGNILFSIGIAGSGSSQSISSTYILNTWTHIAIVRNSTIISMYINGTLATSATISTTMTNDASSVIIGTADQGTIFKGYVSNLRMVKGTAVYTSNFTPTIYPLTRITNTSLLTFNRSNGLTDGSVNAFTLVPTGSPTISSDKTINTVQRISPSSIQVLGYFDEYSPIT